MALLEEQIQEYQDDHINDLKAQPIVIPVKRNPEPKKQSTMQNASTHTSVK
jgi:hypothetical protein